MGKTTGKCLFCLSNNASFSRKEHVIPESLGNDDLILQEGFVCDSCNQYFGSKVENEVLNNPPFNIERVAADIKTKKGKSPFAQLGPNFFMYPNGLDQIVLYGIPNDVYIKMDSEKRRFILIPKGNNDLCIVRMLLKIGLEALIFSGKFDPYQSEYNGARRFARYADPGSYWDLGYAVYPKREDLIISERFDEYGSILKHQIYQYEIGQMSNGDLIFNFVFRNHIFACSLTSPSIEGYVTGFNLLNPIQMNIFKTKVS